MTETHPVYPSGPDCQPNCPGPWSSYHDGYADGYERGVRVPTDDGLPTRTDLEVAANILDDHSRCVTLGPTARNLAVRMSARLRAALAAPPEAFTGQMTWPCTCGHPKGDHYFGDRLGPDGLMHTWCQRQDGCEDFAASPAPTLAADEACIGDPSHQYHSHDDDPNDEYPFVAGVNVMEPGP